MTVSGPAHGQTVNIPLLQFLNGHIEDVVDPALDAIGHADTDLEGIGLNADQTEFKRSVARQSGGKNQIGKTDMMNGEFCIENSGNAIAFQDPDVPGGFSKINGVDDKETVPVLKERKKIEAHCPPVNDVDAGRKGVVVFKSNCGMDAGAFVGKKNIAETQNSDPVSFRRAEKPRTGRVKHRGTLGVHIPVYSHSLPVTNLYPPKMEPMAPFFSATSRYNPM